jgi:hypothetical protein
MGAGRAAEHRAEEQKRAAGIEATRMRIEEEDRQRLYKQQLEAQRQAMLDQTKMMRETKAPTRIKSTVGSQNVGVRTARSKRQSTRSMSQGAASLRIPLNIGGSGGGLNIG